MLLRSHRDECCGRESLRKPAKLCQAVEPVHYIWLWGLGSLLSDKVLVGGEVVESRVRALVVVQLDSRTPTAPPNAGFSTSSTRGTGRRSPLTKCSPRGGVSVAHCRLAGRGARSAAAGSRTPPCRTPGASGRTARSPATGRPSSAVARRPRRARGDRGEFGEVVRRLGPLRR